MPAGRSPSFTSGGGAYEAYGRALARHMPDIYSRPSDHDRAGDAGRRADARAASYLLRRLRATAPSSAASMVRCSPRRFSIRAPPTST